MTTELKLSDVVDNVTLFIKKQESHFVALNKNSLNQLDFAKEAEFAKQILVRSPFLLGVARKNPDSLHAAISNVAAIGISLNPAMAFSYLVPRKGEICLDVSYRGLLKLATDTGTIAAMKAELVYENDEFCYKGFYADPVFSADPFGERGELVGVYAMAILKEGGVLVEQMKIDEVNKIRDDSESYKSALAKGKDSYQFKECVWVKYYTEKVKITVIKRAYKTLPTSKGMELVGQAINAINYHDGLEFTKPEDELPKIVYTDDELKEYKRCVDNNDFYSLVPLIRALPAEAQLQLNNLCIPEAPHGQKGKQRAAFDANIKDAEKKIDASLHLIQESLTDNQDDCVQEILGECSPWGKEFIIDKLSIEHQLMVKEMAL